MELHHESNSPIVDDFALSKVPEALLDPMQLDRSHDQDEAEEDVDECLPFNQDSHRTHVTETQIEELDLSSQRSITDSREHSPANDTTNAPFRSTGPQRHVKAKFTRPVSAGDIHTGFKFGKAPAPKTLDLAGGRKPATSATANPDDPIPPPQPSQLRLSIGQDQQQNGSNLPAPMACNSYQMRSNSRPSSPSKVPVRDSDTQLRGTAPQTYLAGEIPQELAEHISNNTVQESQSINPKDILPILRTAIASPTAKATQHEIAQQKSRSVSKASRLPNQTAQNEAGNDSIPFQKEMFPGNIAGSLLRPSHSTHVDCNGPTTPTANIGQESIQPGRKVTKRKPATKTKSAAGKAQVQSAEAVSPQDSATSNGIAPPTEEEQLLEALWLRYWTQLHQRKIDQSQLKSTAAELTRTQEANGTLQTRLHETQHFAERAQAELNKNKSNMAALRVKLGKLTEHISGLSNEHMQLKQDSICIRNRQEEIGKDKAKINATMKDVHLAELTEVKTNADHRIRLLEQTVENQERQLEEDWDLLRTERDRNLRLEAEIKKISDKHDELMRDAVVHRQAMSGQLSELLIICEKRPAASSSDNDVRLETRLQEFTNLMKELRDADRVTPSDFQKLNSSVRNYAEYITKTLESGIKTTVTAGTGHQALESKILSKLNSLCAGLKNEQTLGEQVAEIRESKAIIRERLQATEVALAEARQHSHGLQQKVQFLQQRISDLEVETATLRSQPTENLLTALRQKELEDKNTQLLADIVKDHEDAKEAAEVFAGQAQFLAEREEQIKCLNAQAEELRANLTALHEEKTASEQRAAARCDKVRDQVLAAANTEKRKILNAHANTLHQLKCQKIQKDEAEFRVEELSSQLVALKNAEGNKNQASSNLRAHCANLEIRSAEKESRVASLQEKIRRVTEVTQSNDAELTVLREAKASLTTEVQSKDAEIKALSKTNSLLVQRHQPAKEGLAVTISEADVKAAQILTEVQVLLKDFGENIVPADTWADAMAALSQVLLSAKKNRQDVLDAKSAAANFEVVSSSDFKASNTARSSPGKPRRRANRGVGLDNANLVMHTDQDELHDGMVVHESQIEETTIHSRNKKTTVSSLGTEKPRITPFSQIGRIESAVPLSPMGDLSDLFPPTPIKSNAQRGDPPLQATQRTIYGTCEVETKVDETRQSMKTRPARRASVQDPRVSSRWANDNLTPKRMPEWKPKNPNAGETPNPQEVEKSIRGGRNVVFDDPAAAQAGFRRMKTSHPPGKSGTSSQVPASPKGILKESNTLKRSAAAAGFEATVSNSRPGKNTKVSESQRSSLGPVIGDSQSPQKTRRRNAGRKSKEQEYSERFSQELK